MPRNRTSITRTICCLLGLTIACSLFLAACGGSSATKAPATKAPPTATIPPCIVPTDGITAFTSPDGTYQVTVPSGWTASCFSSSPFTNGVKATAPDGKYTVYILPSPTSAIPADANGLQLFVQNHGPAFLDVQLKPDSVTPCCADTITFGNTDGVDVQYDLSIGGITSEAEFLAVAHKNAPFLILGLFPSQANDAENEQLHTMIFSSFTFL